MNVTFLFNNPNSIGFSFPSLKYLNNSVAKSSLDIRLFLPRILPLILSRSLESYSVSFLISDNIEANSIGVLYLPSLDNLSIRSSYTLDISSL